MSHDVAHGNFAPMGRQVYVGDRHVPLPITPAKRHPRWVRRLGWQVVRLGCWLDR